jgi:hypothetical protein
VNLDVAYTQLDLSGTIIRPASDSSCIFKAVAKQLTEIVNLPDFVVMLDKKFLAEEELARNRKTIHNIDHIDGQKSKAYSSGHIIASTCQDFAFHESRA